MTKILIDILNMSITASLVALVVMLIRLLLKRAPKIFPYALWIVVFFQFICPFKFESSASFMPMNAEVIQTLIATPITQEINSAVPAIDEPINVIIDGAATQMDITSNVGTKPVHSLLSIGVCIWLLGLALMMFYAVFSYIRMKRQVYDATRISGNIFESDKISTAFVLGFIRPKIYIPTLLNGRQSEYVLKHEQVHIRRRDYLIKPIAFFILTIHWFNPVIWVSYYLMSIDMEMSCDEAVLRSANEDIRYVYCASLVNMYAPKMGLLSPLAFGEGSFNNMKERIKNVINFKKTPRWVVVVCFIIFILFTVGFTTNSPQNAAIDKLSNESTVKGVTVKIESIIKNNHVARIHYSIQDEQNRLGENVYSLFRIKEGDYYEYSSAYRNEDGKLYGTLDAFYIDGFEKDNTELQIDQLRYNQLVGESVKIDLDLSNLRAPHIIEDIGNYYDDLIFLKPDEYNYKLPLREGEGDAWLSNIGIVNNELHVQVKTLNEMVHDGVIAAHVQPIVTDKNENTLDFEPAHGFPQGEDGQIYFFDPVNHKYNITEFVYKLEENDINDLDLKFSSVPGSYLNGTWAVSFDSENIAESMTKDLNGLEVASEDSTGVVIRELKQSLVLENLTVTPLYFEIDFKTEDDKPYNQAFYPTTVITYKDGHEMEYVGYNRHFVTDSGIHRIFKCSGDELIELDKIQSITLDGLEIFNGDI